MPKQALTLFEVAAMALLLLAAGCHKLDPSAGDPADANLAPTSGTLNDSLAGAGSAQLPSASPAGTAPSSTIPPRTAPGQLASPGSYANAVPGSASSTIPPPPPEDTPYGVQTQSNPGSAGYADEYAAGSTEVNEGQDDAGAGYEQAAYADTPPPPLPEYDQPPCPGDNYLWTPGYWNYAQSSYFWVPGVWVVAPFIGALWTPGYWNFGGGRYGFHHGYWGPHIGFYGGINYGYGFFGHGYEGGYWNHDRFEYNRAVTRVNTTFVHNTYVHDVGVNNNHVAYDGGRGGLDARPAPYEQAAAREQHFGALPVQQQHVEQARTNRSQFSGAGGGRPQLLADARPLSGRTAATPQAARLAPLAGREGFAQTGGASGLTQERSRSSVPFNQQPAGRTPQSTQQAQAARGEGNRPPVIINGNEAGAGQERAQGARTGLEQQQQREQQQRVQQQQEQVRAQQQAQQPRPQYTQQPRIVEDQGGSQGRSAAQPRQPYQPQQRAQPQFDQPRPAPAPEVQPRPEQSRPEQPRPQPQVSQPRSAPAPEAPHAEPARPSGGAAGGGGGHGPH